MTDPYTSVADYDAEEARTAARYETGYDDSGPDLQAEAEAHAWEQAENVRNPLCTVERETTDAEGIVWVERCALRRSEHAAAGGHRPSAWTRRRKDRTGYPGWDRAIEAAQAAGETITDGFAWIKATGRGYDDIPPF